MKERSSFYGALIDCLYRKAHGPRDSLRNEILRVSELLGPESRLDLGRVYLNARRFLQDFGFIESGLVGSQEVWSCNAPAIVKFPRGIYLVIGPSALRRELIKRFPKAYSPRGVDFPEPSLRPGVNLAPQILFYEENETMVLNASNELGIDLKDGFSKNFLAVFPEYVDYGQFLNEETRSLEEMGDVSTFNEKSGKYSRVNEARYAIGLIKVGSPRRPIKYFYRESLEAPVYLISDPDWKYLITRSSSEHKVLVTQRKDTSSLIIDFWDYVRLPSAVRKLFCLGSPDSKRTQSGALEFSCFEFDGLNRVLNGLRAFEVRSL